MTLDSSQINFNPSWMQPAPLKNDRANGISFSPEDESTQEIMDPVFAKHRYGREDILALMVKDVKPPDGLSRCLFYVEKAQMPIILQSLNDTEMRLQQNINSSKALSALSRQDRHIVNGSDPVLGNSKWVVAGGNRSFHSHNKPVSNRWSTLASPNNGNDAPSYRNPRVSGSQSFSRSTGASLRMSEQRSGTSNRFRVPSLSNDSGTTNDNFGNFSENQAPSTSTTSASGPWNKVGASKGLKAGETARLLLSDLGGKEVQPASTGGRVSIQKTAALHSNPPVAVRKGDVDNPSVVGSEKEVSPIKVARPERDKWHYWDPNGVQRGPYESKQMQTWFDNGYFDSSLRLCRVGDKNFFTLGELFHLNGAVTPFVSKSPDLSPEANETGHSKSPPDIVGNTPQGSPKVLDQQSTNVWGKISAGSTIPSNITSINSIPQFLPAVEDVTNYSSPQDLDLQKILLEKQRLIEEEQKKLREKEELLQREERERLEKERIIHEKELELQRKQDELQRIAKEKEEELEKRHQQVAEFERQRREALEKMEEKLRHEQLQQLRQKEEERLRLEAEAHRRLEAHKLMLEAEERRKFEAQRLLLEAERRRREEEEANIRAAYEEARRLQEQAVNAEKEQRARLLEERERNLQREREKAHAEAENKRKKLEEKAAAERLRKEEEQTQEILRRRQLEEELSKVAIEQILNESPPPTKNKVAPWVVVNNKATGKKEKLQVTETEDNRGKTLLQIQKEEEVALREKLRQQEELLNAHRKNAQLESSSTAWSNKSGNAKNTWGAPAVAASAFGRSWNSMPTPEVAPIPKPPGKDNTNQKKAQKKQQKAVPAKVEKTKPDKLTMWIIKRVRELNSSVDAEVFASFIEGVDSPNEAEDYIIGYLGESNAVKDFHNEFLNKRIELRPRVHPTAKDDLSGPAAAAKDVHAISVAGSGNSASNIDGNSSNSGKKKKKGKSQKVLDPAILGFRAAGDPNRINAGEIDTAPPVPANRKR